MALWPSGPALVQLDGCSSGCRQPEAGAWVLCHQPVLGANDTVGCWLLGAVLLPKHPGSIQVTAATQMMEAGTHGGCACLGWHDVLRCGVAVCSAVRVLSVLVCLRGPAVLAGTSRHS